MGAGSFSHLDADGRAQMVDVSAKPVTRRDGRGFVPRRALARDRDPPRQPAQGRRPRGGAPGRHPGAKRTGELVPLAHPLPLDQVEVDVQPSAEGVGGRAATWWSTARTGAEMEALVACADRGAGALRHGQGGGARGGDHRPAPRGEERRPGRRRTARARMIARPAPARSPARATRRGCAGGATACSPTAPRSPPTPAPLHLALAASGGRRRPPLSRSRARLLRRRAGHGGLGRPARPVDRRADPLALRRLEEQTLRPRPEAFTGLDLLLVDLQDVGARYYTYAATAVWAAEAALAAGCEVWVLDRPNPLGGGRGRGQPAAARIRVLRGRLPHAGAARAHAGRARAPRGAPARLAGGGRASSRSQGWRRDMRGRRPACRGSRRRRTCRRSQPRWSIPGCA